MISDKLDLTTNKTVKDSLQLQTTNQKNEAVELIKKVYPNPFIDQITIELTKKATYVFKVFEANGKEIKSVKLNTDKLEMNLPDLKSGFYILQVIAPDIKWQDKIRLLKK